MISAVGNTGGSHFPAPLRNRGPTFATNTDMNMHLVLPRSFAACSAVFLASLLSAQDTTPSPPQPPPAGYQEPGVTVPVDIVKRRDRVFLEKASKSGTKEIVVSETVLPNVTKPDVRDFARRVIKDHMALRKELNALADRRGVTLPSEDKQVDLVEKWSEQSKTPDEDYIDEMVSEHKDALELFEKGAKSSDPEIAGFARNALPMFKQHLEEAKRHKEAR